MGKKRNRNSAVLPAVLMALVMALTGCGQRGKNRNEEYGEVIAGLGDDEQFALEDIGENYDVLFTTDMTYDDRTGHNAAVYCDVYYALSGEEYPLGRIESMGTAWPVSYGEKCIYTASEHSLEVYRFDQKKKQWTVLQYEERFDENGNASYQYIEDGGQRPFQKKNT